MAKDETPKPKPTSRPVIVITSGVEIRGLGSDSPDTTKPPTPKQSGEKKE